MEPESHLRSSKYNRSFNVSSLTKMTVPQMITQAKKMVVGTLVNMVNKA